MEVRLIQDELLEFVKSNIISEGVELNHDTPLSKVGVDSYSIVEIILFIERKFGVTLNDTQLIPINFVSIDSIAQLVSNELN